MRLRAEPCATVAALRSLLTAGCDVVHYTGHGVRGALTFELEGRAELDVCTEETLGRLVAAGGHRTKVVFLAACDSNGPENPWRGRASRTSSACGRARA